MQPTQEQVQEHNQIVYAAEAATYDVAHPEVWNWFEQLRYRRLVRATLAGRNPQETTVVDIGAGTGNLTLKYLQAGCQVTSVDISQEMLDMLQAKVSPNDRSRLTVVHSDVESTLAKLSPVDVICFSSVLHHIFAYRELVAQAARLLKPKGIFFNIHDPLIQKPKSATRYFFHRLVGRWDERIYRLEMRLRRVDVDAFPDDSVAEYHQTSGHFSQDALRECLQEQGLGIEHYETYSSRRYGLMSWLATSVIGSENCFTLLARKP